MRKTRAKRRKGGRRALQGETPVTTTADGTVIVQPGDLLAGDVLLYRPRRPGFVQEQITSTTGSPYTHAGICLGDGLVADSNVPWGIGKRSVAKFLEDSRCVGVLRTQAGFAGDRPRRLSEFVADVIKKKMLYDGPGIYRIKFNGASKDYFDNQLEFVRTRFGESTTPEAFAARRFFCSAFVVACYAVVGIIDESAQVAYEPEFFAPGHLCDDPTFGWLLGYLIPEGGSVPHDDPLLKKAMLWRDAQDMRWW
jgi:hypothetical protein